MHTKIIQEYYAIKKSESVIYVQEEITLDVLPLGKSAMIVNIDCNSNLINRIYDLGITPNSIIKTAFKSPFGDPVAYLIKNTLIALRKKDCKNIIVAPI